MIDCVLTFYLNNQLLGVDIKLVKEINRNVEYTPVPDSPPNIVGLFNMRGQIVTLFNLAGLMNYGRNETTQSKACIILKAPPNDANQLGFLIDKPGDVINVSSDNSESPPANVGNVDVEYIECVVKLKNELLIIVDPKKIFKI
jgi:purine-binding chemotaxis protein CheW